MNHIGYFWDPLNGYAEQHDIHEGVILSTDHFKIGDVFGENLIAAPTFRAEGYKYCNVACFYRVDVATFPMQNQYILTHWQECADMKEFGNFVVIIKDLEKFMRRVDVAMQENGFKYCAGDVNYYKDIEPGVHGMVFNSDASFDFSKMPMPSGQKLDSFDKTCKYEKQNEWRISLYRGVKEEKAYDLNIGDLHDIAVFTDIRHMADDFKFLLQHAELKPNWDYKYKGNVNRDELRDLFIALGDHKAELSLICKRDILSKLPPPQKGDFPERFMKRLTDTLNDFTSKVITKEDFDAEIKRLRNVLERSHIKVFYADQQDAIKS